MKDVGEIKKLEVKNIVIKTFFQKTLKRITLAFFFHENSVFQKKAV